MAKAKKSSTRRPDVASDVALGKAQQALGIWIADPNAWESDRRMASDMWDQLETMRQRLRRRKG